MLPDVVLHLVDRPVSLRDPLVDAQKMEPTARTDGLADRPGFEREHDLFQIVRHLAARERPELAALVRAGPLRELLRERAEVAAAARELAHLHGLAPRARDAGVVRVGLDREEDVAHLHSLVDRVVVTMLV